MANTAARAGRALPVSSPPSGWQSLASAQDTPDLLPHALLVQQHTHATLEARTVRLAAALADQRVEVFATDIGGLRGFSMHLRSRRWLPVGSVEYMVQAMRLTGFEPPQFDCYPKELRSYLCAQPRRTNVGTALGSPEPVFLKPQRTKLFDGFVYRPAGFDAAAAANKWRERGHQDPVFAAAEEAREYDRKVAEARGLDPSTPVWCAEPREFVNEYRYYLLAGELIGYARYDDGADDAPAPSSADVSSMMVDAPHGATCSLDVGVTSDGATWLIEVNDAWALGYFPGDFTPPQAYLYMLWARWQQLLALS